MRTYKVVHQKQINQVIIKSIVKQKEVKTVCEDKVGKFFVMVQNQYGLGDCGLGDTIEEATAIAIQNSENTHYQA